VIRLLLMFVVGLAMTMTATIGPARADDVAPELVCRVQDSIRWRAPAWSTSKCQEVSAALNATDSPRELTGICINESDFREDAIVWHGPTVADVGLCGIRCILGKRRRCTNGPAAGLTVRQLQRARTNIAVAAAILAAKGSVGRYNSSTPEIGDAYQARVAVLVAALAGLPVEPKRITGKRLRKLVEQIAAAVLRERNS
jgi:hypothetical protein